MKNLKISILLVIALIAFDGAGVVKSQKNDNSETNSEPSASARKAVRLAEEFIARNGYTEEPADRDNLSDEAIERNSDDTERLLESRHDTLEPNAYGYKKGRRTGKGWTVVFRYSERMREKHRNGKDRDETGRAVTMDKNFENLRVEHKSFLLKSAKKLDRE